MNTMMMMPSCNNHNNNMNNNRPFRSGNVGSGGRHGDPHHNSTVSGAPAIASTEGPVYLPPNPEDPTRRHEPGVGANNPRERRFSPYDFNGGTVAAVAGPDFAVVASDTRLSSGFEILSRNVPKLHVLTPSCVLASAGCKTDVDQLRSVLDIKMKIYQHNHRKPMSTPSVARMLSNTLYYKRFFPYYAFNILAGIDQATGKGVVYGYDAIGSYQKDESAYNATGSGQAYIIPFLDNVIGNKNRNEEKPTLSSTEVVELLKEAFLSAGERDIYTGDQIEIMVITADGIQKSRFALKAD